MVINGLMLFVTVRRKHRLRSRWTGVRSTDRIARLTLRRAIRIELGFLLCQAARLVHTIYFFSQSRPVDPTGSNWLFFYAVLERCFVTFMLVYLSVWDLIDRHRIARELTDSSPEFITSTGLNNLLGEVNEPK